MIEQTIQTVKEAEQKAKEIAVNAENVRQTMLADAQKKTLEMKQKFEAMMQEIEQDALEKADKEADVIWKQGIEAAEEEMQKLREMAATKKQDAISFILEKIV